MAKYKHHTNIHRHQKKIRRANRIIYGSLLIILILGVAIGVYVVQKSKPTAQTVVIQKPTHGYRTGAPLRTYDTEKFTFKSSHDWQFSRLDSKGANTFVYYQQNNNLIEYELDIIFDHSLMNVPVNYIMPVTVQNGVLKTQAISDRCGTKIIESYKGKQVPGTLPQQFVGVNYFCDVLGSKEVAAAGVVGGSYNIPLYDSKGHLVEVNFKFTNDTSSYFPSVFKEVLENFKLI